MLSVRLRRSSLLSFALLLLTIGCRAAAPTSTFTVIRTFPHSTASYTEGFFFLNGLFYEGTGLKGHSQLLVSIPDTGQVVQHLDLPARYFGEGIASFGTDLYEWTWEAGTGFVYDRATLHPLRQFTYSGEGWGMTHDDRSLITSDGSDILRFRDPATFRESRHIVVHDGSERIDQLNELEFVRGEIYANVWHSDRIARISPADGHVLGWIDLTGLLPDNQKHDAESVLNGIAYDAEHDRLFVTGKQWPYIFEIRLVPEPTSAARQVPSRIAIQPRR